MQPIKQSIRLAHGIINTSILVVILLIFTFGIFSIWDNNQIHSVACATRYARYRPSQADGGISFASLQQINPDVFAWLHVFGTNIDYPVVQGPDNFRYVNTSVYGLHSLAGAIFLDYRNCRSFGDFSSIVHGHHMANRVMFGEISYFANPNYFAQRPHGSLYFDGHTHGLDFFAFLRVDAHNRNIYHPTLLTTADKENHIKMIQDLAINLNPDVHVTPDSRLVLLSTCSPNVSHMRDVLVGVITPYPQPNPFYNPQDNFATLLPAFTGIDGGRTAIVATLADIFAEPSLVLLGILITLVTSLAALAVKCRLKSSRRKLAIGVGVGLVFIAVFIAVLTLPFAYQVHAQAPLEATLQVQQTAPAGERFYYVLTSSDGSFPNIYFDITGTTLAQVGPITFSGTGVFTFTLHSTSASTNTITVDPRVYHITIQVENNGNIFISAYEDGIKLDDIHFVHTGDDEGKLPPVTPPITPPIGPPGYPPSLPPGAPPTTTTPPTATPPSTTPPLVPYVPYPPPSTTPTPPEEDGILYTLPPATEIDVESPYDPATPPTIPGSDTPHTDTPSTPHTPIEIPTPSRPADPGSPQTGDTTNPTLWKLLIAGSTAGLIALFWLKFTPAKKSN